MGRAQILGGGANGRYSIRLDFGEADRQAKIAAATFNIGVLTARLVALNKVLDTKSLALAKAIGATEAATNAFAAAMAASLGGLPAMRAAADVEVSARASALSSAQTALSSAQTALSSAETDFTTAENDLENAEADKLAGQVALQDAGNELVALQNARDSFAASVVVAQSEHSVKVSLMESALTARDAAQAAYDAAIAAEEDATAELAALVAAQAAYDAAYTAMDMQLGALTDVQTALAIAEVAVADANDAMEDAAAALVPLNVALSDAMNALASAREVVELRAFDVSAATTNAGVASSAYESSQKMRAALGESTTEAAKAAAIAATDAAIKKYAEALSDVAPISAVIGMVKLEKTTVERDKAKWQNLQVLETRDAWCIDLTVAASGNVATAEVPGETDLILIAPGAPAPTAADGVMKSRELMTPEQAYFNAAMLPGWQKYMPTYRRGTITDINYDDDTASVALAAAMSSAQALDVNQTSTLTNIPVHYMWCHAEAFDVGDEVIVRFAGQSWAAPTVIGFVTNPQPCSTCEGTTTFLATDGVSVDPTTYPLAFTMALAGPYSELVVCGEWSSELSYEPFRLEGTTLSLPAGSSHTATKAFGVLHIAENWAYQWSAIQATHIPGGGNVNVNRPSARYYRREGFVALYSYSSGSGADGVYLYAPNAYFEMPSTLFESAATSENTGRYLGHTITIDHFVGTGPLGPQVVRLTFQDTGPAHPEVPQYRVIKLISCVAIS